MFTARREYFSDLICQNSKHQGKLFQSVKTLLCEPCDVSFPPDVNPKILANEFGKFFEQKIENILQTLDLLSVRPSDSDPNDVVLAAHAPLTTPSAPVIQSAAVRPHLTSFKSLSQEEVQALIAQ